MKEKPKLKYPLWEGSITGVKHLSMGFEVYELVVTYWSDGSTTKRRVPGRIHHIEPIRII